MPPDNYSQILEAFFAKNLKSQIGQILHNVQGTLSGTTFLDRAVSKFMSLRRYFDLKWPYLIDFQDFRIFLGKEKPYFILKSRET